MRRSMLLPVSLMAVAALLSACTQANAPTWTFPPAGAAASAPTAPSSAPTLPAASNASGTTGAAAVVGHVEITAFDLGFNPGAVTVDKAGRYMVTLNNTGAAPHDLTFADGTTTGSVAPATSKAIEVDVPAAGMAFLCSIPGHAAAGMQGTIAVEGRRRAGGDDARRAGAGHGNGQGRSGGPEVHALRRDRARRVLDGNHPRRGPRRPGEDDDRRRNGRRWLRPGGLDVQRDGPGSGDPGQSGRHGSGSTSRTRPRTSCRTASTSTPARSPGTTR